MPTSLTKEQLLSLIAAAPSVDKLMDAGVPEKEAKTLIKILRRIPARHVKSLEEIVNQIKSKRFRDWYEKLLPKCHEDCPVVLFPLRLETRVVGQDLRIRFYPDDVLLNGHDPKLSQDEVAAGINYLDSVSAAQSRGNSDGCIDAWRSLSAEFGPYRAAWIAREAHRYSAGQGDESDWSIDASLGPMPDKIVVYLYNMEGDLAHSPIHQNYVIPGLQILGSDEEAGLLDETSKWVEDYEAALDAGMAVSVPLNDIQWGDNPNRLSRIVAVGYKRQEPETSQNDLLNLLENHHYSGGMAFLSHGTPTNNADDKSGYSSREDHEGSYFVEIKGLPNWDEETDDLQHNASRLGVAFGFGKKPNVFRYVQGATDRSESFAQHMNVALWPVLGDYFLRSMIPGGLVSEQKLGFAYDHFSLFVRASGPLPTLRIGRQPYGILPVTMLQQKKILNQGWSPSTSDEPARVDFDEGLYELLSRLYALWSDLALDPARVPRIGASDDPEQELLEILSMQPVSNDVAARPMLDSNFSLLSIATLREQLFGSHSLFGRAQPGVSVKGWLSRWIEMWQEQVQSVVQLLGLLTGAPSQRLEQSRIKELFGWWDTLSPGPLTSTEGDLPDDYLKALCSRDKNTSARTLLHELLKRSLDIEATQASKNKIRNAICRLASETVLDFFNTVKDAETIVERIKDDPDRPPGPPRAYGVRPSLARRILAERDKLPEKQFSTLDQINAIFGVGEDTFHDILHSFKAPIAPGNIDLLFRQTLDTLSHRLDAWFTSFATKRLESMRKRVESGIHLGAYGYLEDLDLSPLSPQSAGYIHTPSAAQTAAAAVLYNAFLTHDSVSENAHPFHINLTSDRVSRSLQIIQGIREGQSLGALLGYQFERGLHLHEGILEQYIDDFRNAFPIVANKITTLGADEATEAVAARNVVDGTALARAWRASKYNDDASETQAIKSSLDSVISNVTPDDIDKVKEELDRLIDSADAVGDMLMFESIYHAVTENYEAAGATLDAISGKGPPPNIDSFATRVGASVLDHRVLLMIPTISEEQDTDLFPPREVAEPSLAKWISGIMPSADQIGCRYSFTWYDEEGVEHLPLDINTISESALETLPGIGPAIANQVVNHRASKVFETVGELLSADDIDIGPVTFEKIRGRVTCGNSSVSLAELGISAIDFLYLCALPIQGEETELEQRIRRVARERDALPWGRPIKLNLSSSIDGFPMGIDDAAEFARMTFLLISQSSVMNPMDLAMPTEQSSRHFLYEDALQLHKRTEAALKLMYTLHEELASTLPPLDEESEEPTLNNRQRSQIDQLLIKISRFGIQGAFSLGSDDPSLLQRARGVSQEMKKRLKLTANLAPPGTGFSEKENDTYVQKCVKTMQVLFGSSFIVLPQFCSVASDPLFDSMNDSELMGETDEHRLRLWLQQQAEVHPPLERLEDWLLIAEALGHPLATGVGQLPHKPGQRWLGLDDSERNEQHREHSALSIFMLGALPLVGGGRNAPHKFSGFVIHRCQDLVSDSKCNTSVGFHYDAPSAQAPQCLLLAVPAEISDPPGVWSEDKLEAIVRSAMDLAKIRSVDLDALGNFEAKEESDATPPPGLGALIPGLFMPTDSQHPKPARAQVLDMLNIWLSNGGGP